MLLRGSSLERDRVQGVREGRMRPRELVEELQSLDRPRTPGLLTRL